MDFSAQCQGVGVKAAELQRLADREARLGILPRPEIDAFMQVSACGQEPHRVCRNTVLYRCLQNESVMSTTMGS